MVAVGFALMWAGYVGILYGYFLVRGYNVSFRDLFKSDWPEINIDAPGGVQGAY